MRVTIQMPDDLYDLYAKRAEATNERPSSYLSHVLKAFQQADVDDRIIIIRKIQRQRLEELFARPVISDEDLVRQVERILTLSIEGVELRFTPGQKAEIKRVAERNNLSYEEQVKRTVRGMEQAFFSTMPGGM